MEWYSGAGVSTTRLMQGVIAKRNRSRGNGLTGAAHARTALDRVCATDVPRHWACASECYTKWFSGYPCLGKVGDHSNPNVGERPVAPFWFGRARDTLASFDLIVRTESMRDPGYIVYLQEMFKTDTEMTQVHAFSAEEHRPPYSPDDQVRAFLDGANTYDMELYREFALGPGM